MSILSRYLIREFLRLFSLCMGGGVVLYMVIDLFDRIDRLMSHGATFKLTMFYLLYKVPLMVYQVVPAAMLVAVLLTIGLMARNNEILVLRTSGLPVWRIAYPLILLASLISTGTFFFHEHVASPAFQKSQYVWRVLIKKQDPYGQFVRNQIWYKGQKGIYNIQTFLPKKNELQGITFFELARPFQLKRRIDASRAVWKNGRWILHDATERTFRNGDLIRTESYPEEDVDLQETPENFREIQRDAEEMPFGQLKTYIAKIASEGYDPTPYRVELQKKMAYPVLTVITVLLGIPFSFRLSRHGGLAAAMGVSLVLGFTYWIVFAIAISFGQTGLLPPFIAAWSANILFGAMGVYLFLQIET